MVELEDLPNVGAKTAEKLRDAAKIMGEEEISVQLRYLETLREIATENSSTIVFPLQYCSINLPVSSISSCDHEPVVLTS